MAIHYQKTGDQVIVRGHTYPYRTSLKALGGTFDPKNKCWIVDITDENMESVAKLCAASGGGILASSHPRPASANDKPDLSPSTPPPSEASQVVSSSPFRSVPESTLSVSQLVGQADIAVRKMFPSHVWVAGEIQNLNQRSSGIFFSLVEPKLGNSDQTISINGVIWHRDLESMIGKHGLKTIKDVLQDGLQVRCKCQVSLYQDRGQISLTIRDMDPRFTQGELAIAREKLLRELRAQGLHEQNKRIPFTHFPLNIGLISAPNSRAYSDFLHQLEAGGFPGKVFVHPSTMQGENTPAEVVSALTAFQQYPVDAVVLTRGGGSRADLRWFDHRNIAYAIATSPFPVLAAIGHHDDICVAEEVAAFHEKTPTAAADFILSRLAITRDLCDTLGRKAMHQLLEQIHHTSRHLVTLEQSVIRGASASLESQNNHLLRLDRTLQRQAFEMISKMDGTIDRWRNALWFQVQRSLNHFEKQFMHLDRRLSELNPKPWMESGWTQLIAAKGGIKTVTDVSKGDSLKAYLADGELTLTVNSIKRREGLTDG